MTDLKELEKKLIKEYGEIITDGSSIIENPKKIVRISPSFDSALVGVPEGSWVTLSGPSGCGKTTLALKMAKEFQQQGSLIVYLNAEGRLKPMNLLGIEGLDPSPEKFKVISSTSETQLSGEDYLEIGSSYIKSVPRCVLIVDSASSLCPSSEMGKETSGEIRSSSPKILANFCRKHAGIVPAMNSVIIVIKHIITNTSGYGAKWMEDGGVKIQFQADIRITTKGAPEQWIDGNNIIGQVVEWSVLKSACGAPMKTFKSYIRYGTGIDEVSECIELAQDFGVIDKAGSWLKFKVNGEEIKFQGAAKTRQYLVENPNVYQDIRSQVYQILGV